MCIKRFLVKPDLLNYFLSFPDMINLFSFEVTHLAPSGE